MNDDLPPPPPRGLGLDDLTLQLSVSDQEALELKRRFDATLDEACARVESLGVPVSMDKPSIEYPALGVSHLEGGPPAAYGVAWDQHLAWLGYLDMLLAQLRSQKIAADNAERTLLSEVRKKLVEVNKGLPRDAKMSQEALDDIVRTNPVYLQAQIEAQRWAQGVLLVESRISSLTKNMQAISRHITLRGQERDLGYGGSRSFTDPPVRPPSNWPR